MASDMAALAAKVAATQALLQPAAMRRLVTKLARMAKEQDVEPEARAVSGGDGVLSGMGRRGARLGSGYDVLSDTRAVLKPRRAGPWALVTFGSRGSFPVPKRRRRVILAGPSFGPVVATREHPVIHPKVRGKGAWTKVTARAGRESGRRADQELVNGLRKVW